MSYQTNTLTINDAAYFNGLQDDDAICANGFRRTLVGLKPETRNLRAPTEKVSDVPLWG